MRRSWVLSVAVLILGFALVAVALWLVPEANTPAPVILGIIGVILGYNLWRRRSARPVPRIVVVVVLPVLLGAFFTAVSSPEPRLAIALSFLPAFAAGVSLANIIELLAGRTRPKLIRARWREVSAVEARTGDVSVRFDIRPLVEAVSRKDVKAIRSQIPASPQTVAARVQKTLFLLAWPIILLLIPIAFTDETYVTGPDAPAQIAGMAAFFSLLIAAYLVLGVLGIRGWQQATSAEEHLRLARFASANGFAYHPGPVAGEDGSAVSRVLSSGNGWLLGNAVKPSGQAPGSVAPVTQFSGFAEYRLPVKLPHLFLSRTGFRAPVFSSFRSPSRSQRLSLEGDFDRYFDTYCPKGYERDALYLLTPDVMAALIDGARRFDVEIIDDRLILRSRKDLVTLDPAVWATIAGAVSALAGRALQWSRWRDDRHHLERQADPHLHTETPTGPALAGQRLRGSLSLGGVIIAGYAVVYVALVGLANAL